MTYKDLVAENQLHKEYKERHPESLTQYVQILSVNENTIKYCYIDKSNIILEVDLNYFVSTFRTNIIITNISKLKNIKFL